MYANVSHLYCASTYNKSYLPPLSLKADEEVPRKKTDLMMLLADVTEVGDATPYVEEVR